MGTPNASSGAELGRPWQLSSAWLREPRGSRPFSPPFALRLVPASGPGAGVSWCGRRGLRGPAEPLRGGERGSGSPCLPVSGRAEVGPGGGRWEAAAGWARTSGVARLGGGEASRGGGQPGRFRFRSAFRGWGGGVSPLH